MILSPCKTSIPTHLPNGMTSSKSMMQLSLNVGGFFNQPIVTIITIVSIWCATDASHCCRGSSIFVDHEEFGVIAGALGLYMQWHPYRMASCTGTCKPGLCESRCSAGPVHNRRVDRHVTPAYTVSVYVTMYVIREGVLPAHQTQICPPTENHTLTTQITITTHTKHTKLAGPVHWL